MTDRAKMMRQIQIADFALYDTVLFLDTHPNDKQALAYFQQKKQQSEKATALYESKYGPLMARANNSEDTWHWVDGPWPWEMED